MMKLIIFDLDGPILDSFETAKKAILDTRKKLIESKTIPEDKLPDPDEETVMNSWGFPGDIAIKQIFNSLTQEEIKEYLSAWASDEHEKVKLIDGAPETLDQLRKKGYNMGILTSRSRNLALHLSSLDLENLFDFIQSWHNPDIGEPELICSKHSISTCHKPDPEVFKDIFRWAGEKGIKKGEMMLIDDTLVGMKAAQMVGIGFLGVCTGPLDSKDKWQKYGNLEPERVIRSIAELPAWLDKYERV